MQAEQNRRARELVDAIECAIPEFPIMNPQTINEFIKERIARHKQMITTLEWFGAHLGLDMPADNSLVQRVIYEGINALMKDRLKGKL